MNYTKKSFSVAMGNPSSSFSDRWEATFGKKSATETLRGKLKTDAARALFDAEVKEIAEAEEQTTCVHCGKPIGVEGDEGHCLSCTSR